MATTGSVFLKRDKKCRHKNVLTACCVILLFLVAAFSALAESSALSGLGEPASPASLANPARLSPQTGTSQSAGSPPGALTSAPISLPSQDLTAPSGGIDLRGYSRPETESKTPLILHQAVEKSNIDGHGLTLNKLLTMPNKIIPIS